MWANVVITSPTGGNNVSADKAVNSTNGAAFTVLGNLVITEGAATDFAVGNNQTLVLTVADGWQFNPGVGTVTFTGSRNITAASLSVTASTLTVTFSVGGDNKLDALIIGGVQVQALDGANVPGAEYIRRRFEDPGTAFIAGIDEDFTTFGLLNQIAGAAKALAIQTQPDPSVNAGEIFAPQPQVQVLDQFGNLRHLDNTTVVTAARAAGAGTLQGTLARTAAFGVASYTDLSMNLAGTMTIQFTAPNLASVTSDSIVVNPAPADRLVFTTQPASASAGVPFGIQPVLRTQDRFGSFTSAGLPPSKLVTVTLTGGSGTLAGTKILDIGTAAGNGTVAFSDLQIDAAGTGKQLTATSSGLSNAVSAAFAVSSAVFSKLQLLVPGETAAPGTLTGKTGTPSPQAAGTPFDVTVNAVDSNWNLVNTIADTVALSSSDSNATLPASAALVSGSRTFSVTLNTVGGKTLTASDLTDGSKTANTSPTITVGGGTPRKLAIQTQPSTTATAGVPFAQQPVIRVEDAGGNLVTTDNGRVITVARGSGTAALQGTLTATTVNGIATFGNLSYNLAETITLNFTATGLTNAVSGNVAVGGGPFTKLQLLVPGETAAPGTASGKTGAPIAQTVDSPFSVTVNAVDNHWNLVNSVMDLIAITSSDSNAALPANATLLAGTQSFDVTLNTPGAATLTASDLTDGSKTANTSSAITVNTAQHTPATGGGAISADTTGGTFTTLSGPSYSENASGDVGTGTIILDAPAGFIFDTGGIAPTVLITRLAGSGKGTANINGVASGTAAAITSRTTTQIVFTVTSSSSAGVRCGLTWQNVRVRPTAGTPLASGKLSPSGTASMVAVSPTSNFGLLREVAGAPGGLDILTQPSATAMAGVAFAQQPALEVRDQFGNLRSAANGVTSGTVVTAARLAGSGALQGTTSVASVDGIVTFTDLSHNVAANITIQFTAGSGTAISEAIAVSAASASRLAFITQPANATAGSAFGIQPVLRTQDEFGNDSTAGLPASLNVSVALTSGAGPLQGATTRNIGTADGNGTAAFSDLRIDAAGMNYQMTASGPGLASASSSVFAVSPGAVTRLQLLVPGEVAAPVTPSGKTGTPIAQVAGTPFNVTVNAVDAHWNVVSITDVVGITSSDSNAAVPANGALVNGTKVMSVTLKTAGSATVTASDISNPSVISSTSPSIAVNAGGFSKLQILAPGENAAPGTAAGKVGTPAAQTAGGSFDVIINAVDANWNRVGTVNDVVGLTSSDVNATLSANTALAGGTATLSVTPRTAGNWTVTARDITDTSKTSNTTPEISVAAGPFARLQLLVPGETAAPGTATGKTGSPLQRVMGESFSVTVNAVDANWNKVATATDIVGLSSSDAAASLPANTSLIAGTESLEITLNTLGSATITASDLSDGSKPAATSPAITVVTPLYTPATGGEAISADTTGGTFTALTGPVYTEVASGDVGLGTIVLKAPPGFVFNTASPLPTVLINGSGSRSYNINGAANGSVAKMTSVSTTELVFTVTKKSHSGAACKLTWQNVRVRPAAGTPLASGNLSIAGTASLVTVSPNSKLGVLREVPGAANQFAIQAQPSATATAGVPFGQQPVLHILDKFGNFRSNDSSTVVTSSRSAGGGTLQGQTAVTALSGVVTFSNLCHNTATNITIQFSSTGASNAISSPVAVSAAAATRLAFAVQPGDATAGSILGVQPVVVTRDDFGNDSTVGLGQNLDVTMSLETGAGPLQGTLVANIGTGAGNGRIDFSDLRLDAAGANQQLRATANGLIETYSGLFTVNASAAHHLVIQTQPSSAAEAGVAFAPQPVIRVEDIFGNLRTADNSTVVSVARNAGSGALLGTTSATASGGIATFSNLSYTNTETIDLSFSSGALPVIISSSINVGPGPARKLTIVTQPSSTATAGQAFPQQPQVRLEDQYGNVRTGDNSTIVTASRGSGTGTLQGTTAATVNAGVATFTDLSYPLAETMKILFTSGSASNALSGNVVVSAGAFTKLLTLAPGETAAPGTATGKTGTPTEQLPDTAFNVTVRAVDDNWNLVSTATDTVAISSSDIFAALPANAALVGGTKQFSVKLSEAGITNTITASDVTDSLKTPGESAISVSARFTSALGGSAIPASTAGGDYTSLIGPTYTEAAPGEAGKGTIILSAPAGFVFDTGGTPPTVRIETVSEGGRNMNINNAADGTAAPMTSVNSTQLVFTISTASSGNRCKLTWQDVRVRPIASSPLAIGKLTKSGTSVMVGVANGLSNLGTLREVADEPPAAANLTSGDGSSSSASSSAQNGSISGQGDVSGSNSENLVSRAATITGIRAFGGMINMTFIGRAGATYQIERALTLQNETVWTNIGSAVTDLAGAGEFTDTSAPQAHAFYRAVSAQ
jgi:hypothetical protein